MAQDGAPRGSPPDAVTVMVTVVRKPPERGLQPGPRTRGRRSRWRSFHKSLWSPQAGGLRVDAIPALARSPAE